MKTYVERPFGFTLIEVIVVMGIVTLLLSVLLPSLSDAREQGRSVVCRSNIKQIMLANGYYAEDHGGVYCPGASEFLANLHRWHGVRDLPSEPFDSTRGPLAMYLGPGQAIRQCPTFPAKEIALTSNGFERGNGGYGYNNDFIGTQMAQRGSGAYDVSEDRAGALIGWVVRPAETIMFADSAFATNGLIEYSFAEPRFHPQYPKSRAVPSIHFRHNMLANVGWCDGHVDGHTMTKTRSKSPYRAKPDQFDLGWFGKHDDNRLFDLK